MANPVSNEIKQIRWFCLLGVCLIGIAIFSPSAAHQPGWSFFQIAQTSPWGQPLDWPAAWCSLKIILFSFGSFLLVEAVGSLLALAKLTSLALSVFFLHLVSGLGMLVGTYYLLKALL